MYNKGFGAFLRSCTGDSLDNLSAGNDFVALVNKACTAIPRRCAQFKRSCTEITASVKRELDKIVVKREALSHVGHIWRKTAIGGFKIIIRLALFAVIYMYKETVITNFESIFGVVCRNDKQFVGFVEGNRHNLPPYNILS